MNSGKRNFFIILGLCLSLALITWAVFGQAVGFSFVNYDDPGYVYKNHSVSRGLTLPGLYWAITHSHPTNWHPLTTISHMVDCQLFGLNPAGPHFVNVLLHTIAVLLLFLLLWQMSQSRTGSIWASAFVAAVFAIHPLRVESVAWVSERKDVLSGVFFMLTLGAYLYYTRRPTFTRYLTVSILYALGLMAKPMLVTVPFVLLLLDYWPLQRLGPDQKSIVRALLEKVPLLLLAAASSLMNLMAHYRATGLLKDLSFSIRLKNALVGYVTYISQMFWPTNLAAFYPYTAPRRAEVIVALIFLGAVSVNAVLVRRKYPYLTIGWFWYVVMLVPVIGLIQVGLQSHADRYTYLPEIGLYLALTWLVADLSRNWPQRPAILGAGAVAVLAMLGWSANEQTRYWRDSGTLWRHALAVTNDNYLAHSNLAAFLPPGAESLLHAQEALQIQPQFWSAHFNFGRNLASKGEADKAIDEFQTAVKLEPLDLDAWTVLGNALRSKGRAREATYAYARALAIDGEDVDSLNGMAWILATCPDALVRNGPFAVRLTTAAVELSRHQKPGVLRTLAAAYAESGQFDLASSTAHEALNLALTKSDSKLADRLKLDIDLYDTRLPLRDLGLTR
jgi:tetratricopeptide (TPR) repeat protein